MALSLVGQTINNEEDTYFSLGPIGAANSRRKRLRVVVYTDGTGIPGADYFSTVFGASTSTSATADLANLDSGTTVWAHSAGWSNAGETAPFLVGGASNIFACIPYVSVGNSMTYTVPIPEFTGADRHLIFAIYVSALAGSPVVLLSLFIEDVTHDGDVPGSEFVEFSWLLPATTIGFANIGPFPYFPGAKIRLDFGTDVDNTTFSYSLVTTTSDTKSQAVFDAGQTIIGPTSGGISKVAQSRAEFAIPPFTGNRYVLLRMDVTDPAVASAHLSTNLTVEGQNDAGILGRSRTWRGRERGYRLESFRT